MSTDAHGFSAGTLSLAPRFRVSVAKILLLFFWFAVVCIHAAEKLPPPPTHYFNDYAHKVSAKTTAQLESRLEDFERKTSSQIVVAIFPRMETDSSLEDYAQRIYQSWGIGQKRNNNGALLLIFLAEHKMRIQTGYGLEGALPDAICKRIIEDEIAPRFRQNDFDGGVTAGVNAILAAAQGEYKGTGRTVAERGEDQYLPILLPLLPFLFIVFISFILRFRNRRSVLYGRRGTTYISPWFGGGGSSWGGGGGGGFSGGGFSGGGGSSGGGGASGGW
jgi:uncharacterized protein